MSGYRPCACRDCMETAIGKAGALCWQCLEADCVTDAECQSPYAYQLPDPPVVCEHCHGRLGAQDPGTVCGMCKYA